MLNVLVQECNTNIPTNTCLSQNANLPPRQKFSAQNRCFQSICQKNACSSTWIHLPLKKLEERKFKTTKKHRKTAATTNNQTLLWLTKVRNLLVPHANPPPPLRHIPSAPQLPFHSAPWYEDLQNTSASSPSLDVWGYGKQRFGEKFLGCFGNFSTTTKKLRKHLSLFYVHVFLAGKMISLIPRKRKTQINPVVSNISTEGGYDGVCQIWRFHSHLFADSEVATRFYKWKDMWWCRVSRFFFREITDFWLEKNRRSSEEGLHYETMKTWLALNPHLVAHLLRPFSRENCYPFLMYSLLSTAQTRVVSILIKHQNSINFPHLSTLGSLDYHRRILVGDHLEFRHMAGKS